MRKILNFFMVALAVFSLMFFSHYEVSASGLPINVQHILPDNQEKGVESYISIKPKTNSLKQEFQFEVTNITDKEQEVIVDVVDAYTSPSGAIQYVAKAQKNSEIVDEAYKLSNYLKLASEEDAVITLQPNEKRIVKAKIDVEGIDGTLLGGLVFSTLTEGEKVQEGESTFKINNKINIVLGVMIEFGTDKDIVFTIDEPYIDPMPAYYVIRLPLALETPVMKNLKINYQVFDKDKELFTNEAELHFAPMAKTYASLAWEHEEIERNKPYVLKGKISYLDHEEKLVEEFFEKEVVYTGKEKEQKNTEQRNLTTPIEKGGFPIWLSVIALLAIAGLAGYVFKKKLDKKKVSEVKNKENEIKEKN